MLAPLPKEGRGMANDSTWRRLPVWVTALLGAAVAVTVIASFGSSQAQAAPDLSVRKTIKPKEVRVGDNQVYTIRITNNTNTRLKGVTMRDPLPSGVKFLRASTSLQIPGSCRFVKSDNRTVKCGPYVLKRDRSFTVKIYVKAVKAGTFRNVAYVSHEVGLGATPERSDAATHRAVKVDGGDRKRDGGGKKGRCGVEARAGSGGARACVGGVKAGANS